MRNDLFAPRDLDSVQRTALLLGVAAVFIALGVAATGGTAGAPGDATGGSGVAPVGFEQTEIDPDDVLIETAVDADGDATWEIQYRVRLSSAEEEQAFADLRTDVESNTTTYTDRFSERMTATAAAGLRWRDWTLTAGYAFAREHRGVTVGLRWRPVRATW